MFVGTTCIFNLEWKETVLKYIYFHVSNNVYTYVALKIFIKIKTFFAFINKSNSFVMRSCTDVNNYMIKSWFLYQFKYFYLEATALSVLVNLYPLRQKGSDVGCIDIDSTSSLKTLRIHYSISFHSKRISYISGVMIFHILQKNEKGFRPRIDTYVEIL